MRGQLTMFSRRWAPVAMVITLLIFAFGWGVTARSQMQQQQQPQPGQIPGQTPGRFPPIDGGTNSGEDSAISRQMQAKLALKRNADRQAQLVKDTDKLFDLAKELKTDVDKTNQDVLSVEVVKKADEIEKLAKSVRDKMKAD
jgi:hypothetical protein